MANSNSKKKRSKIDLHYSPGDEGWKKYVSSITKMVDQFNITSQKKVGRKILQIIIWLHNSELAKMRLGEGFELYKSARLTSDKIVEIGTCRGGSTVLLGLSNISKSHRVYSYDIVKFTVQDVLMKQFNLKCNLITGDGAKEALSWDNEKVGFLFVDGEHTEKAVANDLECWYPHLSKKAVIALHDHPTKGRLSRWKKRGKYIKGRIVNTNSVYAGVFNGLAVFMDNHPNEFVMTKLKHTLAIVKRVS